MSDQQDDLFLQRRLLLASVLSAVALTAYVYMAGSPKQPPVDDPDAPAIEQPAVEPGAMTDPPPSGDEPPSATIEPSPATADAEPAARKAAESEKEVVVETDTYVVKFSNRGAVATSWTLKHYNDAQGEPLDLVHTAVAKKHGFPFTLVLPGGEPLKSLNEALFVVTEDHSFAAAPKTVTFQYSDGAQSARKTFRFDQEGYLVEVESEVHQNGVIRPHLLTWNIFGDIVQTQDWLYSTTFYFDPSTGGIERNEAADAEEARITNTGAFTFAGIDDLFFTAAFLPPEGTLVRMETSAVGVAPFEGSNEELFAALAIGTEGKNNFRMFVGPKGVDILAAVLPAMRQIVDFGYSAFIAEPIFWMMRWTYSHVVANYGWAIILVTVVLNFVLFPLKWKGMSSMKRMQALQPLVKEINEKYKGLGMRDPKKAQQNEELMGLYKKHGVNPMGGCLPMLLQLPFFIGFYSVLTVAIELRHAQWLWVTDLAAPEQLAIRILPVAMVVTQFWQQSMTPTPSADPAQMRLMKFMPLMFGFIFYGFQSGLVLFWLTSNLVGVGQQVILNRWSSEGVVIERPKGRRKKKKKIAS